jgi:hypothetical protein
MYRVFHKSLRNIRTQLSNNEDTHSRKNISSTCKVGQKVGVSLSLSVDMLPFDVTIPATVTQRSDFPEGLINYPVLSEYFELKPLYFHVTSSFSYLAIMISTSEHEI